MSVDWTEGNASTNGGPLSLLTSVNYHKGQNSVRCAVLLVLQCGLLHKRRQSHDLSSEIITARRWDLFVTLFKTMLALHTAWYNRPLAQLPCLDGGEEVGGTKQNQTTLSRPLHFMERNYFGMRNVLFSLAGGAESDNQQRPQRGPEGGGAVNSPSAEALWSRHSLNSLNPYTLIMMPQLINKPNGIKVSTHTIQMQ